METIANSTTSSKQPNPARLTVVDEPSLTPPNSADANPPDAIPPLNLTTGNASYHGGITIIPLLASEPPRAGYITLAEAITLGFQVSEVSAGGHVPQLLVQNPLDQQVLLYDGEEVIGAKQNRILEATILVAAGLSQQIPVACVEAGRWSRISDDFSASDRVSHPESRRRKSRDLESAPLAVGHAQSTVWSEIDERINERSLHSSTRALADVHEAERPNIDAIEEEFQLVENQCGAVLAIGNTLCLDYVSRPDAWEALWPKIRRGYLLDGLRYLTDEPTAPARIAAFVEAVAASPRSQRPSPGLGLDQRLHGTTVTGSGLALNGEVLQLSAYSRGTQGQRGSDDRRISRPSARRR